MSDIVRGPTSRCTDPGATVSQVHTPTYAANDEASVDIARLVSGLLEQSLEHADRDTINGTLQSVRSVRTWLDAL